MAAKLQYLWEVKDYFGTEESKYYEFLRIFRDFTQKVDGDTIVGRVKILFNGDERLVMGFYRLLLDTKRKPTMARPADEFSKAFESVRQMMKSDGNYHSNSNDLPAGCSNPELEIERAEVDMGRIGDINMTGCGKSKKCSGHRKLVNMQHIGDRFMNQNFDENKKSTSHKRKRDNKKERHDNEPSSISRNEASQKRSSSSTKEVFSHLKNKSEFEVKSLALEDHMFEVDILLSSVTQTAKKLVEKIKKMRGGEEEINEMLGGRQNIQGIFVGEEIIEERPDDEELTIANLVCAERFYSDTWIDIQLALIRENPMELVGIVSNLLRWKEDIEKSRVGLHAIAREAFARNTILMRKTAARST